MATTSFSKTKPAETTEPPTAAVIVREEQPLAPAIQNQGFSGAWDSSDINYPRINLVHKTSNEDLITKFGIGSFVLNKEVKLSDGKTPLEVVVAAPNKDFIRKKAFGDPVDPANDIAKTVQEVHALGGTLNKKDSDGSNWFIPRANIIMIVAAPEGASDTDKALFPYEFKGKDYAIAVFTVSSSAFTSVGREIATLGTQNKFMKENLLRGTLALTSKDSKDNVNQWKTPVIKFISETNSELVDFYKSILPS